MLLSFAAQRNLWIALFAAMLVFVSLPSRAATGDDPTRQVIHISVDGLRPDAVSEFISGLPGFQRLRVEGAFTDNARTDFDYSITLPNHVSQLTGLPVTGSDGHNWVVNTNPAPGQTLHSNKGEYVTSVFDVAHDNGLRTGAYVSKSKFSLFDESYNEENGAPDNTGEDNGRDKIDVFVYRSSTEVLVDRLLKDLKKEPFGYVFLHLKDPDAAGHANGFNLWPDSAYMRSIRQVDKLISRILDTITSDPVMRANTTIILTADHGGGGGILGRLAGSHSQASHSTNYTIPFYTWGAGVTPGNLYEINEGTRTDPGGGRPAYGDAGQPLRNADAANLALSLHGLSPVPGSKVNYLADLRTEAPDNFAMGSH